MPADPKLLEILICPLTRTSLRYDPERQELISRAAALAYPIRDGVPVMLPGEARELTEDERDGEPRPRSGRNGPMDHFERRTPRA